MNNALLKQVLYDIQGDKEWIQADVCGKITQTSLKPNLQARHILDIGIKYSVKHTQTHTHTLTKHKKNAKQPKNTI